MSFLLDTDTCSGHLKGNRQVTSRFLQYTGQLFLSTVALGELCTWALRAKASPKRLQDLQVLLNDVHVLEFTSDAAWRFGKVRAELLDKGLSVPDMDLLIAATALVHDFTLVTHNTADYANVPGLKLVDWMVP